MSNSTDYALELTNVTKQYNSKGNHKNSLVLQSLNLKIDKGTIFGLLGPNGAGKSTTINIVSGLTNKSSGSVRIWGYDQDKDPEKSRSCIGVVPQELNLDPFLCPRDALKSRLDWLELQKIERQMKY